MLLSDRLVPARALSHHAGTIRQFGLVSFSQTVMPYAAQRPSCSMVVRFGTLAVVVALGCREQRVAAQATTSICFPRLRSLRAGVL